MMKKIERTIVTIILGLLAVAIFSTVVWLFMSEAMPIESEASREIIGKQSEKSMFFGPRYQVSTSDAGETELSYVSKRKFDSLQLGDQISGFNTTDFGFMTKWDYLYEGSILLFLAGAVGLLAALFIPGLFLLIPAIDQLLTESERKTGKERRRQKKKERRRQEKSRKRGWLILHVVTVIGLVFCISYTVNVVLKLAPFGKTMTEAEIVKGDYWMDRTGVTAYLTIKFTANDGKEYRVKKQVTGTTYNNREEYATVNISYRNHNPYHIFINTQSGLEIFGAFFHSMTLFFVMALAILYMCQDVYRERYEKLKSEKERRMQDEKRKGKSNLKNTHQKNRR